MLIVEAATTKIVPLGHIKAGECFKDYHGTWMKINVGVNDCGVVNLETGELRYLAHDCKVQSIRAKVVILPDNEDPSE